MEPRPDHEPPRPPLRREDAPLHQESREAERIRSARAAAATFQKFSPSHRKEYIQWITEAKRDETRARRPTTALEWLAEGKPRNWKYEKC